MKLEKLECSRISKCLSFCINFIFAPRNTLTNRPFFLYLSHNAPHIPLTAPKSYLKKMDKMLPHVPKDRRMYFAVLNVLDDQMRRLILKIVKKFFKQN